MRVTTPPLAANAVKNVLLISTGSIGNGENTPAKVEARSVSADTPPAFVRYVSQNAATTQFLTLMFMTVLVDRRLNDSHVYAETTGDVFRFVASCP